MIRNKEAKVVLRGGQNRQSPTMHSRKLKSIINREESLLKGINIPILTQRRGTPDITPALSKLALASPEESIEQIKGKIQEYLTQHS
jgi:hypothetical protein